MLDSTEMIENETPAIDEVSEVNDTEDVSVYDVAAKEEGALTDMEAPALNNEETNYEELALSDLKELKALFPELWRTRSITELNNPLRYAALRDLGLSPKEAYLATADRREHTYNNRGHLTSSVPRTASGRASTMTQAELESARLIFHGLSDREIQRLYNKVTQ